MDWSDFYKRNYKSILANKDYSELRIDHKETIVFFDRFHQDYFRYLKALTSAYSRMPIS